MIRNVSKICSFTLLFLLLAIGLNEFKIMSYSDTLKSLFLFSSLILIVFSSALTVLTSKSGFFKFVGGVNIAALAVGGIMYIIKPSINIAIYICIVITGVYSMIDIFYKKS